MVSLAGEAVIRLPATVPRLRICGAPTSQQARASGRLCASAGQEVTISACCPEWSARTETDDFGRFEFAALTAEQLLALKTPQAVVYDIKSVLPRDLVDERL